MSLRDDIVIASIARTPLTNFLGQFQTLAAHQLGSTVIKAVIERANISRDTIDEIYMGCVLPAGQGQAPARQAMLNAGINEKTPATTLNKVCGSGMKAMMLAHDGLLLSHGEIMIAGGMESMTNAPYLLSQVRQGYRLGAKTIEDHLSLDGLEDPYHKKPMGYFAEMCAKEHQISRQEQDEYALTSFLWARKAIEKKYFVQEIVPISVQNKMNEEIVAHDEHPFSVDLNKMAILKPVFSKEGTVTAANSSCLADGAAALLLMKKSTALKYHCPSLARIVAHVTCAKASSLFPIAPIDAISQLLKKINWSINEVDLFEINEAFAVVVLVALKTLKIPREKINIYGGACALGHPIGATGARIVVTLISALKQNSLKKGIAVLCIGGGEATAIAIEVDTQ